MSAKTNTARTTGKHIGATAKAKPVAAAASADTQLLPSWTPIAIAAFTALLYLHSLSNNFTVFDDDVYIINNPYLKDFSARGIWAIFTSFYSSNYHPFTTLTWFCEYNLFGVNPLPFHLVNAALHVLNTWLVYKLVANLSGRQVTAAVVALLFGIHPMHVESVAWISERKDVLYAAFYLSSLLLYLRYTAQGCRQKDYVGTLLLFVAALLSKSAAVTLPVLLFAIDIYKGRKIDARAIREKIPFFVLSVVFGIITILSQNAGGALNSLMMSYGLVNGIFIFCSGPAFYIAWLAAPLKLAVMHYFPDVHNGVLPWVYYLSLPFVLVLAWLCTRPTRYRREIFFGVSFFLITISVMLQLVSVGSALTAERYSYIPSIGLFYIAGQWIADLVKGRHRNLAISATAVVAAIFSIITWNRIGTWKEDRLLFNDMIETYPEVYYGYWLRGNLEKKEGDLQAAIADYSESMRLNGKFGDAVFNRGITYNAINDLKDALADFNRSVELSPKQADVYNNRGWVRFRLGDKDGAMSDYNKAISLNPNYAEVYNNRGWAYQQAHDMAAAMHDYDKAIELNPVFILPLKNRASVEAGAGNYAAALQDYNTLLKINADDNIVYYYRGLTYLNLQNQAAACQDWEKARELGNQNATAMMKQYCH